MKSENSLLLSFKDFDPDSTVREQAQKTITDIEILMPYPCILSLIVQKISGLKYKVTTKVQCKSWGYSFDYSGPDLFQLLSQIKMHAIEEIKMHKRIIEECTFWDDSISAKAQN